jgi:small subunit ribosomal protein S6
MATRRYETAILFDPDLHEDQRRDFMVKLAGVVASYKGGVVRQDDWGMRKLAYPIRKKQNAYYTFLGYTGEQGVVEEVERNLKIFDGAIRFLTTRYEDAPKAKEDAGREEEAPEAAGPAPPAGEAPSAPPSS